MTFSDVASGRQRRLPGHLTLAVPLPAGPLLRSAPASGWTVPGVCVAGEHTGLAALHADCWRKVPSYLLLVHLMLLRRT